MWQGAKELPSRALHEFRPPKLRDIIKWFSLEATRFGDYYPVIDHRNSRQWRKASWMKEWRKGGEGGCPEELREKKAVPISQEAVLGLIKCQIPAMLIAPFSGEPGSFCISCHLCFMSFNSVILLPLTGSGFSTPGKTGGILAWELCLPRARLVDPCSVVWSPPDQIKVSRSSSGHLESKWWKTRQVGSREWRWPQNLEHPRTRQMTSVASTAAISRTKAAALAHASRGSHKFSHLG